MMIYDSRDIYKIEVYDLRDIEKYPHYDDFEVTIDNIYEENDNIVIAISGKCYYYVAKYTRHAATFNGTLIKDISDYKCTPKTIHFDGTANITYKGEQITDSDSDTDDVEIGAYVWLAAAI